jgi:hypothetical protein
MKPTLHKNTGALGWQVRTWKMPTAGARRARSGGLVLGRWTGRGPWPQAPGLARRRPAARGAGRALAGVRTVHGRRYPVEMGSVVISVVEMWEWRRSRKLVFSDARECVPGPQGRPNRPPSTISPGVGRRRRPIDGRSIDWADSNTAQQPVALLAGDLPHPNPLGHPASSRRPDVAGSLPSGVINQGDLLIQPNRANVAGQGTSSPGT